MRIIADNIGNYTDESKYQASLDIIRSIDSRRYEEILRVRHDVNKRLHLAAGMLIKDMCDRLGIIDPRLERTEYGKPYIKGYPKLYFNLSHSGEYAVIAYGDRPVGIDIQKARDVKEAFARRIMNEAEYSGQDVPDMTDSKEICRIWTIKEAYSKLIGIGLSYDFRDCVINHGDRLIEDTTGIYPTGTYRCYTIDDNTYMALAI